MQKKRIGLAVIIIAALGLAVAGYLHWKHGQLYPSTDNAYVAGDVTAVASRVPGVLVEVGFQDNEPVIAGQVLAQLDPRDFDTAIATAEADLAKAIAALAADSAQIAGARAQLVVARSEAVLARADRDRYATLQERGSAPERQSEQATTAAEVAEARATAAEKALLAARARLAVDEKAVAKSRAQLAEAQLRREYCTITAPTAGIVADKSAQPGQVVGAGQPLCRIAPLSGEHLWIDANFKETQLARIEVGQPVTVEVDAVAGHEFKGTVAGFAAGTGAAFALLPPENASGNWVKIVQRLPVRIALAPDDPLLARLRLGLSAQVTVDTQAPGSR
ncbi:MAG: HlyD family secretion protein [Candidatus Krumholzibacteriia bacterium]